MKTTYPKKQKTKVITTKKITQQNTLTEQVDEQQIKIDNLKSTITKSDLTSAGIKAEMDAYAKIINHVPNLETNLEVTNNHANYAHVRIDELEAKVDAHISTGGSDTEDLANIILKVDNNTKEIEDLQQQDSAFEITLETQQDNVNYAIETAQSAQAGCNQNTQDISNLTTQVQQNTQTIQQILQTGVEDGNAELELIELTQQVTTNKQDIADLKTQQTTNTADIASLIDFKNRFSTPADPYYTPKTYTDYEPGTIIQTYDCYERKLNLQSYQNLTLPTIFFTAEAGSSGTIKVEIEFSTNNEPVDIAVQTFLNDTEIDRTIVTLEQANVFMFNKDIFDVTLNAESKENRIYCKVGINNKVDTTCTRVKIELLAPNSNVLNRVTPYYVEYIDGKYYVSDCSSGRAMLATIPVEDMQNMNSLEFVDLGFDAQWLDVGKNTISYDTVYTFDQTFYAYKCADNKLYIYNGQTGVIKSSSTYLEADWILQKNKQIQFCSGNYPDSANYLTISSSSGSLMHGGYATTTRKNIVKTFGAKILDQTTFDLFRNSQNYAAIDSSGEIVYTQNNSNYASTNLSIGYGEHVRIYFYNYNSFTDYSAKLYVKRFDKIVEYDISYKTGVGFTVNSIKEIGSYDDFFLGAKGDYFVVKNGKLQYHYFPTEQTTQTETTTE